MSKRFGRNQRRKLRENLHKTQVELQICQQSNSRVRNELTQLSKFFELISERVGQYAAIAGKPSILTSSNKNPNAFTGYEVINCGNFRHFNTSITFDSSSVKKEVLRLIHFEDIRELVNGDITVYIRFGEKTVALGLSKQFWWTATEEMLRHQLTELFTNYMIEDIFKQRRQKNERSNASQW